MGNQSCMKRHFVRFMSSRTATIFLYPYDHLDPGMFKKLDEEEKFSDVAKNAKMELEWSALVTKICPHRKPGRTSSIFTQVLNYGIDWIAVMLFNEI